MARSKTSTVAVPGAGTGAMERVEVVTRGERRRSYSPEEKARLLAEAMTPGARVLEVARRHGVCASLLHRWRRQAEGRPVRRQAKRAVHPAPFVPLLLEPSVAAGLAGGSAARGSADASVEVLLRNGRVLRVGAGADAATVARLAAALEP